MMDSPGDVIAAGSPRYGTCPDVVSGGVGIGFLPLPDQVAVLTLRDRLMSGAQYV